MVRLNTGQQQIVDPILTQSVQIGPAQGEFVGSLIFPPVPVEVRKGRIVTFDEAIFTILNTRRNPGDATNRKSLVYNSTDYQLYQDSIEGELPYEWIENIEAVGLPINIQQVTALNARAAIDLRLEYDQISQAINPNNYGENFITTLSGTSQWDNTASLPKVAVNEWKEQVRQTCGKYPNTAVMSSAIFNTLDTHPEIRDQFKYTSDNSLTVDMLKRYFNLDRIGVSTAIAISPGSTTTADIMPNQFWLGYVNPTPQPSIITPSWAYTYRLKGYPIAEVPYYERNNKTWYFPVTDNRLPVITFSGAAFLAQDVISSNLG